MTYKAGMMGDDIRFVLDTQTVEKLQAYSELLKKDPTMIMREALHQYFDTVEKSLLESHMTSKDPATDIGFDEFWDGVDIG